MCKRFEGSIIDNASTTLAGIKVASLFNFSFSSVEECRQIVDYINARMNKKGVYIEVLKNKDNFYLIYVYRKSKLQEILRDKRVSDFLYQFGYDIDEDLNKIIDLLKYRISYQQCFPHEIGVFLGYPIDDVISFIENSGKNCLLCGIWKVYHDEQNAIKTFVKYNHCKEVYQRCYNSGRNVYDMVVNA